MESKMPLSNWIWSKAWTWSHNEEPHIVVFRKKIMLSQKPEQALVKVSADSRYKLYVNGVFVNAGPRKGDNKVWFYDELELKDVLKAGENVIYAQVLRYPLAHRKGNHGIWRTEFPGFYMQGNAMCGKEQVSLDADEAFKSMILDHVAIVSENPFFAPLQILERASGDCVMKGAMDADYDDSRWSEVLAYPVMAIAGAVSPGNLLKRPIPLLLHEKHNFTETVCVRQGKLSKSAWDDLIQGKTPVTIPAGGHEIVEIGAGELMTGYLTMHFLGGRGAKIQLLTSECYAYEPKGERKTMMAMPVKGDRTDSVNGQLYGFTDTYTVDGYGDEKAPEIYEPYWFRTFRYIRLDICTQEEPLVLDRLDYVLTGYPLEAMTKVHTSDESHDAIWDISLRTLRRCMHETYEDCPFYEQLQYAMDTRSQILYTYMVSGDDRLARQCIDDFHRSQRYDGLINCSYPCYGPNVIPGFSIYYILMIYDHMMYFGDMELVRRYMPTVEGILDFFRRNRDERGLVGKIGGLNGRDRYWSFIDWTTQWDATTGVPTATLEGPVTMESLLYIYGLMHASQMMAAIGRKEDAALYMKEADEVKKAVNAYCMGEEGLYQDGPGIETYSQHCQVFAVLTEMVTGDEARRIMLEVLDPDKDYAQCSVAMAFYMFRAVEKAGLYDHTQQLWEPWRQMVKNHMTTCVEDSVNGRSDCHAWGSLALYELPAVVLGVRPGKPGFETIRISPVRGYLTRAEGDVVTPKGMVHVRWHWDGTSMNVEAKGPENVRLEILPLEDGIQKIN